MFTIRRGMLFLTGSRVNGDIKTCDHLSRDLLILQCGDSNSKAAQVAALMLPNFRAIVGG
ncbi:hypothetical protein J7M28_11670 [bacterium]|nr:hypothetical protein [bacterium]